MRFLIVTLALLTLSIGAYADVTPGTIISTVASASYADAAGQPMPNENSNQMDVLVTPITSDNPVMLNIRSLYLGPSTVGRTVKVVGRITVDGNGVWMDDGSTVPTGTTDVNGNPVQQSVYCRVATSFLSQPPTPGQFIAVTGYSQIDVDGKAMVVPALDDQLQTFSP